MPRGASSTPAEQVGYDAEADLRLVADLQRQYLTADADRARALDERRVVLARLRDHDVTVRRIAEAMNVTEGAVQATLRVKRT